MGVLRAVIVVGAVALGAAALVAVVSRTPAEMRAEPARERAASGASFTDEQVARHGRYRAPLYLAFAVATVVEIVTLTVLATGPGAALVERVSSFPGGVLVHAALSGGAFAAILSLVLVPLGYVRGFALQHAWGLSTQDVAGWISDQAKGLLVGAVVTAVAAAAFFAVVRWRPGSWWFIGWLVFTALSALLVFVYPVAIAPLFNRFTPLPDAALRERLLSLSREAGVNVDEVLVADASRRTTAENAYVAGFGATKRLVLYDTLVEAGDDEVAFVVAHELGHRLEGHIGKNLALGSAAILISFLTLAWLAARSAPWSWAGASGIGDVRALPLLLLFATVAGLVLLPVENALSRHFEREADAVALRLTEDPGAAVRTFRRLAFANLADLRPPALAVWVLFSHPPIPERIHDALRGAHGLN